MPSFVENVNKLSLNLDTIVKASSIFDDSVLPVLQEVADLDLQEVTADLKKGNYLGNRKIDIALSLNNRSTTTSVSYSGVTILLTSGVSLSMPFLNGEGNPLELTSHADIKNYIANHELYAQVLSTELTVEESVGTTPTLIRFRDADGGSSNVERVELSVYLGDAVNLKPVYFWAQTTSALQTIANRVGDIIALGNDIDSIVQLSSEIDSMLDLQNNLPELNTIHANLAEILLIDDKTAQVLGYKADAEASALSASQNAGLAESHKNTAQIAASTATQRANEIKAITVEALTGTAGAPASVAYNDTTGKFSFYIPQGLKGDKGDAFTVNATGTFAQRVNYNTQPTGFSFLATDTSMIYFKNSATSGDWSAGSAFGKGDKGDTGDDGRSVLSISKTAGTGASGSTDTYTITYSDTTTSTFQVYNGLDSDVESVNGRVGAIVLSKADVGLTNVDNTSDANKPVSTATQTALDTKANNNKSINIGTTAMALDRASASQSLTGVSIDGNAGTATKLATARTINGVSFDGSASINIEDRLGTAIASAATTTLGSSSSGDTVHITGTTTITSFGASVTGVKKTLIFDAALTLTHNGTSLILPASVNIVTAAGDTADFVCENGASGNWRCTSYQKSDGTALSGGNSTDIERTSSPVFGLLYNVTDDLYKRIGKNINYLTIDGFNEFSAWRSPTAERQNDADTVSPSPLTAWLDSSANLPYSFIKRYVIDNTGAEIKAYNADSYTHADQTGLAISQQVMVKIPAFYHIQARIVDGGKTYMLFAVANSSFTLDAISDLGFASPTITMWNPTTGVSSGTVSGNVITSALHPAFVTNAGGTLTKRYYGAFNAVSGRSICGSGVKATGSITRTAARTSVQGFGSGFTQIDWLLRSALDLLAIVERGSFYMERGGASTANKWEGYSWNSGASSNDQDNGKTLALLNKTGVILDGSNRTIANSWRGIENYHSALWNWVDGVNLASNVVYLAKNGAAYDDSSTTTNGYFSSGITVPSTSASYISDLGAGTFIPTAVAGSATTKMTDGAWTGSTALYVGGGLDAPSTSGVCAWYSGGAASYSGWGIVARPAL